MGKRRTVTLNESARIALERVRDTAPKPFQRERAAAILKVASGTIASHVAREGLLKPRDPDTVYDWLDRFETYGLQGILEIQPGRGRKPAFSPCVP